MTRDADPKYTLPEAFLAWRRLRLGRLLGVPMAPLPPSGLAPESRAHLLQQARELYWEELSWEHLTHDEDIARHGLVELAFPGFLAFVDGLLLREARPDSPTPATPRPEVAEDILLFLAERCIALEGESEPERAAERDATLRLVDLVLYRLHAIPVEETDRLDLVWADEDDDA
jgi:hypothetical protein